MSNEDTGLYQRTVEASYGEVDAFVTHSWSDDGAAKFKQLQTWVRAELERARLDGRHELLQVPRAARARTHTCRRLTT